MALVNHQADESWFECLQLRDIMMKYSEISAYSHLGPWFSLPLFVSAVVKLVKMCTRTAFYIGSSCFILSMCAHLYMFPMISFNFINLYFQTTVTWAVHIWNSLCLNLIFFLLVSKTTNKILNTCNLREFCSSNSLFLILNHVSSLVIRDWVNNTVSACNDWSALGK